METYRVRATAGSVTLKGGADSDEFLVTSGGSLDLITGTLTVDAEGGDHNVLLVDDSGDADADLNVQVGASQITGLATGTINYFATGGWFESINDGGVFSSGVAISAGTGGSIINVQSTRATPGRVEVTRVNAGAAITV